jgi:acetyl esterase/lipase
MRKMPWLAAALGLPLHPGAQGGPLRDLIAQRMAERQASSPDGNPARGGAFDLPSGASVQRDIAYGPDPAERIDVYQPAKAQGAPIVFMVHGGGWSRGDKGMLRSVKNKVTHWVELGYVLVSVNYRVLPDARPIEQASDVAKALAFVQSKAASWGGDASRVVLMGHSAGAHLIALIAADPSIALSQGAQPWVGSIALDSAAYDVPAIMQNRHFPLYDKAFGGTDAQYWRDASPVYRMKDKLSAPMLLVCSSRRADSCAQARGFATKATSIGGNVKVVPVDMSHAEINDLLGAPGAYTESVASFIRSLGLP